MPGVEHPSATGIYTIQDLTPAGTFEQRIDDLLQPVLRVVLEGCDSIQMILRRGDVARTVVGQRGCAVQRIGGGEQAAQCVIRERGGGVRGIEGIPGFSQQTLRIVEEPRDLIVRIGDGGRIPLRIIRNVRLVAFRVRDARDQVEGEPRNDSRPLCFAPGNSRRSGRAMRRDDSSSAV